MACKLRRFRELHVQTVLDKFKITPRAPMKRFVYLSKPKQLRWENLEDIASVDGVDGVFIGPADLAASMGFTGQPDHPDVVKACEDAIARLGVIGCPAGILTLNENFSRRCIELGTLFTAVGVDLVIVVDGAKELRQRFNHV